jgi:hypothetical protein
MRAAGRAGEREPPAQVVLVSHWDVFELSCRPAPSSARPWAGADRPQQRCRVWQRRHNRWLACAIRMGCVIDSGISRRVACQDSLFPGSSRLGVLGLCGEVFPGRAPRRCREVCTYDIFKMLCHGRLTSRFLLPWEWGFPSLSCDSIGDLVLLL